MPKAQKDSDVLIEFLRFGMGKIKSLTLKSISDQKLYKN